MNTMMPGAMGGGMGANQGPAPMDLMALLASLQNPAQLAASGQTAPPMSAGESALMALMSQQGAPPQQPVSQVPDLQMILQMLAEGQLGGLPGGMSGMGAQMPPMGPAPGMGMGGGY